MSEWWLPSSEPCPPEALAESILGGIERMEAEARTKEVPLREYILDMAEHLRAHYAPGIKLAMEARAKKRNGELAL